MNRMTATHLALATAVAVGLALGAGCSSGPGDVLSGGGGYGNMNGNGPGGGNAGPNGPGGTYAGGGQNPDGGSSDGGGMVAKDAAPPPPSITPQQALAQVGACMKYADFQTSGLIYLPQAQTLNSGDCLGCHNQGDGSFWASYGTINGTDESMMMFQKTQTMPYLAKYIAPMLQNGQFAGLQASNAIANKATLAAQCVPSAANGNWCHPQFQLDPNTVSAINTFVQTTLTRWQSNQCPAAPPPATDAGAADAGVD